MPACRPKRWFLSLLMRARTSRRRCFGYCASMSAPDAGAERDSFVQPPRTSPTTAFVVVVSHAEAIEAYPRLPCRPDPRLRRVIHFVDWYNGTQRHRANRLRDSGLAPSQARTRRRCRSAELYERTRRASTERTTRNWLPIGTVILKHECGSMAPELSRGTPDQK